MKAAVAIGIVALAVSLLPLAASAQEDDVPPEIYAYTDVLFTGDAGAVTQMLQYKRVPCRGELNLDYTFPECPEGIPEGQVIDAFPSAGCEGAYVAAAEVGPVAELLSQPGPEFVGLYRASPEQIGLMAGDYIAVYTGMAAGGVPGGVWLSTSGIHGVNGGCPWEDSSIRTLEGFVERFELEGPLPARVQEPANVRICVESHDVYEPGDVMEEVVAAMVTPMPDGATVSLVDGCASLENFPAGTYHVTLRISRGVTLENDYTLQAGDEGTITTSLAPPVPGGLPDAGTGWQEGSDRVTPFALAAALALAGVLFLSGSALVWRRRA